MDVGRRPHAHQRGTSLQRVLSRTIERSLTVTRYLPLLLIAVPLTLLGQTSGRGGYEPLTAHLKAIGDAGTDAARDSASALVKKELGGILSSDSAMTASFADVPISRVDAPDGAFRLFTWNVRHGDGSFLYEGYLLIPGRKKQALYELRDMTGHITKARTVQLTPENWYGALYYAVVPVKRGGRTYYTLLGWKGYSAVETRKVIEVLGLGGPMPKFGAPLFAARHQRHQREIFAYTAQASMQLKWMPERKAIVLDHLSPTSPEFAGQPAFTAPDLSFDSYTWDKDHWQLERDIDLRQTGKSKPYNTPPKEGK